MSLKKFFKSNAQTALTKASKQQFNVSGSSIVESYDAVKQKADFDRKIFAFVDISASLNNYVRFGLAEYHYESGIQRIYNEYPYDGSQGSKYKFLNDSTTFDYYIWKDLYPKTTGHINLGTQWTSSVSTASSSLGFFQTLPASYIKLSSSFAIDNIYTTSENKTNNLELDFVRGNSVEFWLMRGATSGSKETLVDIWNGAETSSAGYGRFSIYADDRAGNGDKFNVHFASGTVSHTSSFTATGLSSSIGSWHHYAITAKSDGTDTTLKFFLDGSLSETTTVSSKSISQITGSYVATIGALATVMTDDTNAGGGLSAEGWGRVSGSFDEFRFWKQERTISDIGLNWNTHVNGGNNTADEQSLGVYYKFNEGITGISTVDNAILDYSGRVMNSELLVYDSAARSTTSAITEFNSEFYEVPDPIIYSNHPTVSALESDKRQDGIQYDVLNRHNFYDLMPEWIRDQDTGDLKYLSHVIGSYFDDLYAQISTFEKVKTKDYQDQDLKIFPFYERLVESHGFDVGNFLIGSDILAELNEKTSVGSLSSGSITDLKSKVYRNIYNNLLHIYKSKGTNESIRNLLHCYNVDQNLIRLRNYSNFTTTTIENRDELDQFKDKTVDFYGLKNYVAGTTLPNEASVFHFSSSASDSNNQTYISSLGKAFTIECNTYFPTQPSADSDFFFAYDTSGSIFGVHSADSDQTQTTWFGGDACGMAAYTVHSGRTERHGKFALSSSNGKFTAVESDSYEIFDGTNWNLALIFEPQQDQRNLPSTAQSTYWARLIGYQVESGQTINSFNISSSISYTDSLQILPERKRIFIGAERTNYTGSLVYKSQARVGSCKFYADSLEEDEVFLHAKYKNSEGRLRPFENVNRKNDDDSTFVPSYLSMLLHWDFEQVGTPDSLGQFEVKDVTSASISFTNAFGGYGSAAAKVYTGLGYNFPTSIKAFENEFVSKVRTTTPEESTAANKINAQGESTIIFTPNEPPTRDATIIGKSMYDNMSRDMLKSFAGITDFNHLIGSPVNKYRMNYKEMEGLRRLYFETVENTPHLEKFTKYFKWLDGVIEAVVENLLPATTNLASEATNIIESHALERNKFPLKYPTLENKDPKLSGTIDNIVSLKNVQLTTTVIDDPRTGAATTISFASSSARTPNYVNVVEVGATLIPSGNVEPVVIINKAYITSSTDDRPAAVTTRDFATSTIGNYRNTYEVINAVGQKGAFNGKYLEVEGTQAETNSDYVSGVVDYSIPDRNKYKTVIRSIFNAPGSPETMMGGLDTAARELSVYNNLNYRNRGVRDPLNTLYKRPSAFGGYQSGSTVTASYHGIQRNGYTRKAYSGDSVVDQKVWDNAFVQTQIPATDLQYAWIAESYASADLNRYQTSSILAPNEQITFVSSSEYVTFEWSDGRRYAFAPRTVFDAQVLAGNVKTGSDIPVDFVGMNNVIYEPITDNNTLTAGSFTLTRVNGGGFDGYFTAPGTYVNLEDSPTTTPPSVKIDYVEPYKTTPGVDAFLGPEVVLNALLLNRNGPYGYPSWKAYRKDAHPIVRAHKEVNTISFLTSSKILNSRGGQIILPSIRNTTQTPISRTEPMFIQLSGTSFDFKSTYENNKLGFTAGDLQVHKGGFEADLGKRKTFLDKVLKEEELIISKLTVRSNIYPKTDFQYLDATRTRDVFDNKWWRNDRSDRILSSNIINSFGFNLSSSLYWEGQGKQSRWSMDARDDFSTSIPETSGVLNSGRKIGPEVPSGSGELQNSYTTFHFFPSLTNNPDIHPFDPLYSRRTIEYVFEDNSWLPNIAQSISTGSGFLNTGEALWEVGSQSGKTPFYNSYDAYAEELRIQGKDYSIVSEFIISDHIDSYLESGLDFKTELTNFLSLTGSSNTSIATRYSAAELSEVLGTVQKDTELGIKRFGLKASALLKLLPYEGFYPQQRTVQLATELSKSYKDVLEGFDDSDNGYFNPKRLFYDPYVSPGILFNTIKSGLAVDYPLYDVGDGNNVANYFQIFTGSLSYAGDYTTKQILNATASGYNFTTIELNAGTGKAVTELFPSAQHLNKLYGISSNFPSDAAGKITRVPFEAILDPYQSFNGKYSTTDPNNLAKSSGTFALVSGNPKINYKLMANNFFAETVNFFLKDGLTSFESKAADLFTFDTTKQYAMDVVITNGNISSVSEYTDRLVKNYPQLTSSTVMEDFFLSSSIVATASADCLMYDRADAFGFPSCVDYITGSGINILQGTFPKQGNFTPPYYHGFARARYKFTPSETQHTMGEIIASTEIEYYRADQNALSVVLNDPTFTARYTYEVTEPDDSMQLSSSFILDAVVETKKVIYDADGDPAGFEEFDSPRSKLVIHPKYECPILNFKNVDITRPEYGSTTAPKGMWHQYGEIPDYSRIGIFTQVLDIPTAERTTPSATASLADTLGIQKEKKGVGRLATSRQVEEALIVLPYYVDNDSPDQKTKFFEFDSNTIQSFMKAANKRSINDEDDQIVRQIRLMKKYVFPPFLDFVSFPDEANVKKPLMYIFEFGRTLSQQDLADIWQGVLPDAGITAVKREAVIDLDTTYANMPRSTFVSGKEETIETIEIIEGNIKTLLASTQAPIMKGDVKLLDKINFNDLDFFVFKVKKRGEFEYSKVTKNTTDDQFQFDFKATGLKSQMPYIDDFGQKRLSYSYNYPYDFFSLIELAKVDAQIEMSGDEEE